MVKKSKHRSRGTRGSAIAEFAPALMVLGLISVPMFDLMGVGVAFVSGYVMNVYQTREVALAKSSDASAVAYSSYVKWASKGMGRIARMGNGHGDIKYVNQGDTVNVTVTSKVMFKPPLMLPFIPNLPGVSAPVELVFSSARPMEDPKDAVKGQPKNW